MLRVPVSAAMLCHWSARRARTFGLVSQSRAHSAAMRETIERARSDEPREKLVAPVLLTAWPGYSAVLPVRPAYSLLNDTVIAIAAAITCPDPCLRAADGYSMIGKNHQRICLGFLLLFRGVCAAA